MVAGPSKNTRFPSNPLPQTAGLSIWEKSGWIQEPDAIVLGTGIVGMNTALELRALHPDWHIVMLDRSAFGGASTRNAGFACFGSPSELAEDLESLGTEALVKLVDMRWAGLNALKATWNKADLGYTPCGALEAFTDQAQFERITGMLPALNALLEPVFDAPPFQRLSDAEIAQRGLKRVCGAISSPLEGALDTGKMVRAMRRSLTEQGIEVIHGIEATELHRANERWSVSTMAGSIQTERVFVCTNAWASAMLDVDVAPAPNVVVVSQPLPHLALNQTLHHDRGYVYARAVRGRLLIGGGRNWNCDDDAERGQMLVHWAQTHIQGAERFDIDHQWVGQLGVGAQRMPIVKELEQGLYVGVRLGGMGVAIGTNVGRALARLCP